MASAAMAVESVPPDETAPTVTSARAYAVATESSSTAVISSPAGLVVVVGDQAGRRALAESQRVITGASWSARDPGRSSLIPTDVPPRYSVSGSGTLQDGVVLQRMISVRRPPTRRDSAGISSAQRRYHAGSGGDKQQRCRTDLRAEEQFAGDGVPQRECEACRATAATRCLW